MVCDVDCVGRKAIDWVGIRRSDLAGWACGDHASGMVDIVGREREREANGFVWVCVGWSFFGILEGGCRERAKI